MSGVQDVEVSGDEDCSCAHRVAKAFPPSVTSNELIKCARGKWRLEAQFP
jgi:hypothetical protein